MPVGKLIDKQVVPRAPSEELVTHDLYRENGGAIGVESADQRKVLLAKHLNGVRVAIHEHIVAMDNHRERVLASYLEAVLRRDPRRIKRLPLSYLRSDGLILLKRFISLLSHFGLERLPGSVNVLHEGRR